MVPPIQSGYGLRPTQRQTRRDLGAGALERTKAQRRAPRISAPRGSGNHGEISAWGCPQVIPRLFSRTRAFLRVLLQLGHLRGSETRVALPHSNLSSCHRAPSIFRRRQSRARICMRQQSDQINCPAPAVSMVSCARALAAPASIG
jgi:hypothetical protein